MTISEERDELTFCPICAGSDLPPAWMSLPVLGKCCPVRQAGRADVKSRYCRVWAVIPRKPKFSVIVPKFMVAMGEQNIRDKDVLTISKCH